MTFADTGKEFRAGTKLTLLGRNPEDQSGFANAPLYKGSTIIYKTLDDFENLRSRFYYGTAGSPTIANLEDAWTELTGAAGTVLSPSGLGSIALALLSFSKAGDHILITDSTYEPTRLFSTRFLAKYGVEAEYYDPLIGADIEKLVRPNTSIIFLESPGSQTLEVQDVPAIAKVAQKHNIITIIDNTWATPVFFRPHDHGIDVTIEAGTKYLGGHSDMLLGLTTANQKCWPKLRQTYDAMAMLPGAEDCQLALRGMRSLAVRLRDIQYKSVALAKMLQNRPEVETVLHPALESCPGHKIWKRDFKGCTGVFSIVLKDGIERNDIERMLNNMKIFGMGLSWGGYESLIVPFQAKRIRTATKFGYESLTLRLQVGLEDLADLEMDLQAGLDRLNFKRKAKL
ncbi:LAMI_0G16182g1_1 [Lachancea mirantina]|uniref:LAMI_0G16182g1_1 n=1 Tax=Lachancea mirantina TaxID=1230905 RepID=A0A1G4KCL9_9SACH|nr:LAMI_0G16182g1_1 [Lachancea mirantina]